jgi:protein-S-isoprenylcysteine O-methyltransferase Ste14
MKEDAERIPAAGSGDHGMFWFLAPLLIGFVFNWASAPTGLYIRRFGERRGRALTFLFRNLLGIPVWAAGLALSCGVDSPQAWPEAAILTGLGWIWIFAGSLLILWALVLLGMRSIRPTSQDTLISRGIYRFIRHPIHAGVLLEFLGLILTYRTIPVLIACLMGVGYVWIQTRLEEADLLARIPPYREYMETVPRFLPHWRNPTNGRPE